MKTVEFKKIIVTMIVISLIVGCSSTKEGVVITKRVDPPIYKKGVTYIGKVMIPTNIFVKRKFVLEIKDKERIRSIVIDSITYSQIHENDSVYYDKNRIIKHW